MEIQFNTDNNIEGKKALETYVNELVGSALSRYEDMITRIEIHLGDENGNKKGPKDKKCTIECRMKGMDPIAVTSHEDNLKNAVSTSIDKMKAALTTRVGKMRAH